MTADRRPDQPVQVAPTVGWETPSTRDGAATSGATLVVLWVSAIAATGLLVLVRTGPLLGSDAAMSSREIGYVVGTALGGLIIALVLRWIYVRVRGGPILRSRWIPITMLVLAVGNLLSALRAT